jgi:hypothetical protein
MLSVGDWLLADRDGGSDDLIVMVSNGQFDMSTRNRRLNADYA